MHDVVERVKRLLPVVANARGEAVVRSRQLDERRQELQALTEALKEKLSQLRTLRHRVARWHRARTSAREALKTAEREAALPMRPE